MSFRVFLGTLIIAVALGVASSSHTFAAVTGRRPNVIILLADDLGYGDLACFGHPKFKTPNLDAMAAEGARLTQFNTPTPFCGPTRASLLTGRYPFRCGLTSNPAPDFGGQYTDLGLPTSEITLAQLFRGAGYATGMVGKWHLGHSKKAFYPIRRGFDDYFGILYSNDMRPVQLIDGEEVVEYPVVQTTLTKRYTERALKFITANKDKPFFLYFAHAMPHKPLAVSEKYYNKSGAGLYGDVISELDDSVGQVFAKLNELDIDNNTFVVFTSDNGPSFGGSTGGLRGMKGTSFEGGYRVPFIARWPGKIPANHVSNEAAVTMDLFSTALAIAGIAAPSDRVIDGADIRPLLTSNAKSPHDVILGSQGPRLATVRDAEWKLHVLSPNQRMLTPSQIERWIDPRAPDGVTILAPYEQSSPSEFPGVTTGDEPVEMALFHLSVDPAEQHNVASANPDIVKHLKSKFDAMAKDVPPQVKELPRNRKNARR
jgi:uncharacterized sulfatase